MRRWAAGQSFTLNGLRWRIQAGKKGPHDLRLEVLAPEGWLPVRMAMGWMQADFFYENEDVLYPPPAQGGQRYLHYVDGAARLGWETAQAMLESEQNEKRRREAA
jgi:hypothetical protein